MIRSDMEAVHIDRSSAAIGSVHPLLQRSSQIGSSDSVMGQRSTVISFYVCERVVRTFREEFSILLFHVEKIICYVRIGMLILKNQKNFYQSYRLLVGQRRGAGNVNPAGLHRQNAVRRWTTFGTQSEFIERIFDGSAAANAQFFDVTPSRQRFLNVVVSYFMYWCLTFK